MILGVFPLPDYGILSYIWTIKSNQLSKKATLKPYLKVLHLVPYLFYFD